MRSQLQMLTEDPRDFDAPRETCCTCGDDLTVSEPRECSECEGDRLAATPCATGCGRLCNDREPPVLACGPVCPFCYLATL